MRGGALECEWREGGSGTDKAAVFVLEPANACSPQTHRERERERETTHACVCVCLRERERVTR